MNKLFNYKTNFLKKEKQLETELKLLHVRQVSELSTRLAINTENNNLDQIREEIDKLRDDFDKKVQQRNIASLNLMDSRNSYFACLENAFKTGKNLNEVHNACDELKKAFTRDFTKFHEESSARTSWVDEIIKHLHDNHKGVVGSNRELLLKLVILRIILHKKEMI